MFLSYLLQNTADSDKSRHIVSWINMLQRTANVFYLTWIMSLHYRVKLKVVLVKIFMLENRNRVPMKISHCYFQSSFYVVKIF